MPYDTEHIVIASGAGNGRFAACMHCLAAQVVPASVVQLLESSMAAMSASENPK